MEASYMGIGMTVTLRADLADFPVEKRFEICADLLRELGITRLMTDEQRDELTEVWFAARKAALAAAAAPTLGPPLSNPAEQNEARHG